MSAPSRAGHSAVTVDRRGAGQHERLAKASPARCRYGGEGLLP